MKSQKTNNTKNEVQDMLNEARALIDSNVGKIAMMEAKLIELENENAVLKEEKKNVDDKLADAQQIIESMGSRTVDFISSLRDGYIDDEGKWIRIKWYQFGKWVNLGKMTFDFVKDLLLVFNVDVQGTMENFFKNPFKKKD